MNLHKLLVTRPFFPSVCKMNVHKRCSKNVANNCGINTKDMAKILNELGMTGDKFNAGPKRKKVNILKEWRFISVHFSSFFFKCGMNLD